MPDQPTNTPFPFFKVMFAVALGALSALLAFYWMATHGGLDFLVDFPFVKDRPK